MTDGLAVAIGQLAKELQRLAPVIRRLRGLAALQFRVRQCRQRGCDLAPVPLEQRKRVERQKPSAAAAPPPADVALLTEIRDLLARK